MWLRSLCAPMHIDNGRHVGYGPKKETVLFPQIISIQSVTAVTLKTIHYGIMTGSMLKEQCNIFAKKCSLAFLLLKAMYFLPVKHEAPASSLLA